MFHMLRHTHLNVLNQLYDCRWHGMSTTVRSSHTHNQSRVLHEICSCVCVCLWSATRITDIWSKRTYMCRNRFAGNFPMLLVRLHFILYVFCCVRTSEKIFSRSTMSLYCFRFVCIQSQWVSLSFRISQFSHWFSVDSPVSGARLHRLHAIEYLKEKKMPLQIFPIIIEAIGFVSIWRCLNMFHFVVVQN